MAVATAFETRVKKEVLLNIGNIEGCQAPYPAGALSFC
jgi:hypothetical protein